jgi:hypothetical protein
VRHSERFNSGVMTITPSEDVFKDLLGSITKLSSYTGCAVSRNRPLHVWMLQLLQLRNVCRSSAQLI